MTAFLFFFLLLIPLVLLISRTRTRTKLSKEFPEPDGSLPLLGHLLEIRIPNPWIKMKEWSDQLGPIYRLKLGRSKLIVLGSAQHAVELLERRSAKYSSRPANIMASDYVSRGLRLTFMPYNDLWRRERKLLHLLTQPKQAASYHHIQAQESLQLARDLYRAPQDHWKHCQRYASSTVLQITYDRRAATMDDPAVVKMRECNQKMVETAVPGRYLIDSVPMLDYLPELVSPWKRYGRRLFEETLALFGGLYRQVPPSPGPGAGCFVHRIEELKAGYGLSDAQAIFLAGAMFGAGSDTTADAIETFIFACAAHPDKLARAQEELDRVVGRGRLPEFADQDALVYCGAMVRELLRWRTVIPGGLAHMTTEDDEYAGWLIPKGSTVVANHWAIHLDPQTYDEPESFLPERFIDPGTGALRGSKWAALGHHAFGFGRRICPGIHIANNSLFITFARIMWAFDVRLPADLAHPARRAAFVRAVNFSPGFSSHPTNLASFSIQFVPRHPAVHDLLGPPSALPP